MRVCPCRKALHFIWLWVVSHFGVGAPPILVYFSGGSGCSLGVRAFDPWPFVALWAKRPSELAPREWKPLEPLKDLETETTASSPALGGPLRLWGSCFLRDFPGIRYMVVSPAAHPSFASCKVSQ